MIQIAFILRLTRISKFSMCLIIMNRDLYERVEREVESGLESRRARRARNLERRRAVITFFRRLFSRFAGQTLPPGYDEGTSISENNAKSPAKRPDSLTLPQYQRIRTHAKEGLNRSLFMAQGQKYQRIGE